MAVVGISDAPLHADVPSHRKAVRINIYWTTGEVPTLRYSLRPGCASVLELSQVPQACLAPESFVASPCQPQLERAPLTQQTPHPRIELSKSPRLMAHARAAPRLVSSFFATSRCDGCVR